MIDKKKIKLIACDLDGTLLLNNAVTVSDKAFKLIAELKKENIIFVAASGRQYENLCTLFAPVKDDIAYICENGCLAVYQNKILHQQTLDKELAQKITRDILNTDNYEVQISTSKFQYLIPKTDAFYNKMKKEAGIKIKKIADFTQIKEPILKIAMYCADGITDLAFWHKNFSHLCSIHHGRYDWADFTPLGTDKGNTLKILLQHLNISPENCAVFGDYDNDIKMLQLAQYPIVVNSAPEYMKKYGKYLTDTVENGIEEILRTNK